MSFQKRRIRDVSVLRDPGVTRVVDLEDRHPGDGTADEIWDELTPDSDERVGSS
jgi:hypothetical protein